MVGVAKSVVGAWGWCLSYGSVVGSADVDLLVAAAFVGWHGLKVSNRRCFSARRRDCHPSRNLARKKGLEKEEGYRKEAGGGCLFRPFPFQRHANSPGVAVRSG